VNAVAGDRFSVLLIVPPLKVMTRAENRAGCVKG
jgi:hypothetical protein